MVINTITPYLLMLKRNKISDKKKGKMALAFFPFNIIAIIHYISVCIHHIF